MLNLVAFMIIALKSSQGASPEEQVYKIFFLIKFFVLKKQKHIYTLHISQLYYAVDRNYPRAQISVCVWYAQARAHLRTMECPCTQRIL